MPLAVFGIMWAAFLVTSHRRREPRMAASVEAFERDMDLLAGTEGATRGRWIIAPRKGVPFLGRDRRATLRARARRRRVLIVLLDAIALAFMLGLVPPMRTVMWAVCGVLGMLLMLYVWLLLTMKARALRAPVRRDPSAAHVPAHERVVAAAARAQRYVADGMSRSPRPHINGLGAVTDEDVHVVVVSRGRLQTA